MVKRAILFIIVMSLMTAVAISAVLALIHRLTPSLHHGLKNPPDRKMASRKFWSEPPWR
jgi:hypothetical protein